MENALKAKTELLDAKSDIIANLKTINQHLNKNICAEKDGMNQNSIQETGTDDGGTKNEIKKNGIKECCEFIEIHAENGAAINGFLLWVNIQRHVTPENIWKSQAAIKFLKEEITEAKEILWRTSEESILGKMTKRQRASKTVSEINDICHAFTVLSEMNNVPMFLGTSDMVSQTPIYLSQPVECDKSEVNSRLKVIVETLHSILATSGTKNDNSSIIPAPLPTLQSEGTEREIEHRQINTASEHSVNVNLSDIHQANNLNSAITGHEHDNDDTNKGEWQQVKDKPRKHNATTSWRQRLNIVRGTAVNSNVGESLLADRHLVAYGLAKNVTGIQLSQCLTTKGLHVSSCDLLTRYEGAQSLAFKVTVKSCDFEKAISPDIWPVGIGVRMFKFFQKDKNNVGRQYMMSSNETELRTPNNDDLRRLKPILRNSHENIHLNNRYPQDTNTFIGNLSRQQSYQNARHFNGNVLSMQNNNQNLNNTLYNENHPQFQWGTPIQNAVPSKAPLGPIVPDGNYWAPNVKTNTVRFSEGASGEYYV